MASHALPHKSIELLGERRLLTLSGSSSDLGVGFAAFQWEMGARKAILPIIGITELVLRNSMDKEIQSWWESEGHHGFWTCKSDQAEATIISPFVHAKEWEKRAANSISCKNRPISHDDLIAHTSFGTWKNMIGNPLGIPRQTPNDENKRKSWEALKHRDEQCALLWKNVLSAAFPYIPSKGPRKGISPRAYIGARITRVASLRNRVCHWDSLSKVDLFMRYMDMQEIVKAIDPCMGQYIVDSCSGEILSAIESKPRWLTDSES